MTQLCSINRGLGTRRGCNIKKLTKMADNGGFNTVAALLLFSGLVLVISLQITGAEAIGVCNGRNGKPLPSPPLPSPGEVVNLYKTNNIGAMRLYDPDPGTLNAMRGSGIELLLDVSNDNLESLSDPLKANDFVQRNIISYVPDVRFKYIAVGNEVSPSDPKARFIMPAMRNIFDALGAANLRDQIKVSTAVKMDVLGNSDPPSAGEFSNEARPFLGPIISFLQETGSPLLANVYPYFSYIGKPTVIDINYALFRSPGTVITDSNNGLNYQNLFDAMVDSVYSALEKSGGPNVKVVVSESGWPSEGGDPAATTTENAVAYYRGLIDHVNKGTPKKNGQPIEAYLFAMFDENGKLGEETERHFGLFRPNKEPKYQITFG